MKQGEDGSPIDAADAHAGNDRHPARVKPEPADAGFWHRIIHALAFVPEMPQAQIWHLPQRRD